MIDLNNELEVREAEKSLSDRERVCLAGYMLLKGVVPQAEVLAFRASKAEEPTARPALLQKWALDWVESDGARAFMKLHQDKARELGSLALEDKTETELMIEDLDRLMEEAEDIDDKVKIIKTKADIRHKNRAELQNESTSVNFYLPMRCNAAECPLYELAMNRLRAKDKNFKKDLEENERKQEQAE